jgi:hypothetical protein
MCCELLIRLQRDASIVVEVVNLISPVTVFPPMCDICHCMMPNVSKTDVSASDVPEWSTFSTRVYRMIVHQFSDISAEVCDRLPPYLLESLAQEPDLWRGPGRTGSLHPPRMGLEWPQFTISCAANGFETNGVRTVLKPNSADRHHPVSCIAPASTGLVLSASLDGRVHCWSSSSWPVVRSGLGTSVFFSI